MPTYTLTATGPTYTLHVDGAPTPITASRGDWLGIAGAIEAGATRSVGFLNWNSDGWLWGRCRPWIQMTTAESLALAASIREVTADATPPRALDRGLGAPLTDEQAASKIAAAGHSLTVWGSDGWEVMPCDLSVPVREALALALAPTQPIPPDLARLLDDLVAAEAALEEADAPGGDRRVWERCNLEHAAASARLAVYWRAKRTVAERHGVEPGDVVAAGDRALGGGR